MVVRIDETAALMPDHETPPLAGLSQVTTAPKTWWPRPHGGEGKNR